MKRKYRYKVEIDMYPLKINIFIFYYNKKIIKTYSLYMAKKICKLLNEDANKED